MELKFIVDSMLGSLARWLRMLGYDTLYYRRISDSTLLAIARDQNRVLLTRDKSLSTRARKSGVTVVYLPESNVESWLRVLRRTFGIRLEIPADDTRCPICNSPLRQVGGEEVKGEIPMYIWEKYREYWKCTECGKVYWRGPHWYSIEKILKHIKGSMVGEDCDA